MNLDKFYTHKVFDDLEMRSYLGEEIKAPAIGKLDIQYEKGRYYFKTGDEIFSVELVDDILSADLNDYLQRFQHLAVAVLNTKSEVVIFRVLFFYRRFLPIDISIAIDERIENTAKKYEKFNSIEELSKLLKERCQITDGVKKWFLIKTGQAAEDDYHEDESDNASEKSIAFSICGEGVTIPVEHEKAYFASKIIYKNNQNNNYAYTLVDGDISFSNFEVIANENIANALRMIDEQEGGYLKAWDYYGEIEGELLLEKARNVGIISYSDVRPAEGGFEFYIETGHLENLKNLNENDQLELKKMKDIPSFIKNAGMKWNDIIKEMEKEYKKKKELEEKKAIKENGKSKDEAADENISDQEKRSPDESFKIAAISDTSIILKGIDSHPSSDMFLILSTKGDMIQNERQIKARFEIAKGKSGIPQLGSIIEKEGEFNIIKRKTYIKPLTAFVKNKVFKNSEPTECQLKAIEIALNTPDIALIQGPPGTGKTTVIAAILERLNEEYDKRNVINGKVLCSAFQHDAVENVVSRLSVNSLPARKFGKRRSEGDNEDTIAEKKQDQWADEIREKLITKNPQLKPLEEQQKFQYLLRQYAGSPSVSIIKQILNYVISLPGKYMPENIIKKANVLLDQIKSNNRSLVKDKQLLLILSNIKALRTTEEEFQDDGARNAMTVYDELNKELGHAENEILKKAISWKPGQKMSFLKELEKLKAFLLDKYMPEPVYNFDKPKEEMLDFIAEVNEILSRDRSKWNKKEEILVDFLNELTTNKQGIRAAIDSYNFVYAATTQGAEGKEIRKIKTDSSSDLLRYDTVIIDEAGRASPRNLLIPMAQAEKRIILVGDHRQLPHLIDEKIVEKAMKSAESKNISDDFESYIENSMFEHLKKRLEDISKIDGIERTCILDQQYRTHPLLGNFINEQFYKPYGEGFKSPLDEKHFEQQLPRLDGRPALWIDVPCTKVNGEEIAGTSWKRKAEAKVIVKQLKEWLDCAEGQNFSFGVISFYRAQCNEIMAEAVNMGIAELDHSGKCEIKEIYKYFDKDVNGKKTKEEKLRIGTVDQFQGMEFDVVFLSVVRAKVKYSDQSNLGHLVSANRLCVSMSRQKKVLVVVGDAALAESPVCKNAVPALSNFLDLCKTKGKYYAAK